MRVPGIKYKLATRWLEDFRYMSPRATDAAGDVAFKLMRSPSITVFASPCEAASSSATAPVGLGELLDG